MADWDGAGLPDFVLRDGFEEGFADTVSRSPMDTGPQKRRRRFTAAPEENVYPVIFTGAELTTFKTFLGTTLAGGALSFTKTNPRTLAVDTYYFRENPKPAKALGPDTYQVNLPLDKAP